MRFRVQGGLLSDEAKISWNYEMRGFDFDLLVDLALKHVSRASGINVDRLLQVMLQRPCSVGEWTQRLHLEGGIRPRGRLFHRRVLSFGVVCDSGGWGCPIAVRSVVINEAGRELARFSAHLSRKTQMDCRSRALVDWDVPGGVEVKSVNELMETFGEFYHFAGVHADIVSRTAQPEFAVARARLKEEGSLPSDSSMEAMRDIDTVLESVGVGIENLTAYAGMHGLLDKCLDGLGLMSDVTSMARVYRDIRMKQSWKDI